MRHEKAGRLLELARLLASTSEGLTLDEMAARLGVGRRTVERMRDAEVRAALGNQKKRAANVSILWNERESEIIRVLEAA
jgi:transcriptional regulator GlxA family with amidase domain